MKNQQTLKDQIKEKVLSIIDKTFNDLTTTQFDKDVSDDMVNFRYDSSSNELKITIDGKEYFEPKI